VTLPLIVDLHVPFLKGKAHAVSTPDSPAPSEATALLH
jgi:hypothetical protein